MGVQDDQVEQLTPEEDAQADADFEAAFNQTREQSHVEGTTATNDAPAAPTAKVEDEPTDEDAAAQAEADAQAQAAADAQARAQAEADAPVQLTKKQLDDLQAQLAAIPMLQDELRKTRDTTAGKLGSIQQQMQSLADKAAAGQRPAQAQLKRLKAEFPELGQMLEEDLSEAFGSTQAQDPGQPGDRRADDGNQPPVQHQVDPLADERVQHVLRQKDMAIVDAVHPDWRNLKATTEFNEWRQGLPPAAQQLLATTWDAQVMVDAFAHFKSDMATRATQAQAQAQARNQRGKRLDAAIPATTGSPSGINAPDDDAAFEAGFNSVRPGRR